MTIEYKYNYRKFLGFIATEWAWTTEPGDAYLSRYPDNYSNASLHPVFFHLLGSYFNDCKLIENQNRMRKSYLVLDTYWVIQSGYFILATTGAWVMGMTYGKILFRNGI